MNTSGNSSSPAYTRLIAIRHGQTDWNRQRLIQGQLDIPLNRTGIAQARCLAQALAQRDGLSCIYSSDLSRAMQTAEITAQELGLPAPLPCSGLRERKLGQYEGRSFAQVLTSEPEQAERWRRRQPDWQPPDGESLLALRQRIETTMARIASHHLGQQIALFTHGGVLDIIYRLACGLGLQDARSWELPNAAINRLLWVPDTGLSLIGWADTGHLAHLQDELPAAQTLADNN